MKSPSTGVLSMISTPTVVAQIGPLVPGQQVPRKPEAHHNAEERQPDEPDQFPGIFVGPPEKDLRHVREDTDHHGRRAPEMIAQQEPAVVDVVNDILRAGIGMIGGRHVIEHQEDAGQRLHDENKQQHGAEHIGPTGAAWHRLIEHLGLHLLEADALVNERDDFFDDGRLCAGRG